MIYEAHSTDYQTQIAEFNAAGTAETNNTASQTQTSTLAWYPDLLPANLTIQPAAGLQSGDNVVVRWDAFNAGTEGTAGSWNDVLTVKNLTSGVTLATYPLLYDPAVAGNGSILPGQFRSREFALKLPDGTASAGQLEFTLKVDGGNALYEYNPGGTGIGCGTVRTVNHIG